MYVHYKGPYKGTHKPDQTITNQGKFLISESLYYMQNRGR